MFILVDKVQPDFWSLEKGLAFFKRYFFVQMLNKILLLQKFAIIRLLYI